jgi:FAD/FMN-containing dehydrogenase
MSVEEAYRDLTSLLGSNHVKKVEDKQPRIIVRVPSVKSLLYLPPIAKKYGLRMCRKNAFLCGDDILKPHGELLIDLGLLNNIVSIDKENLSVTVESGVKYNALSSVLNSNGLKLGIEPVFSENIEVGEFISRSIVGHGSLRHGPLLNIIRDLEVLLPDGSLIHTGFEDISYYATGYNLTNLFVGSEESFGIITKITLDVFRKPERASTIVFSFDNVEAISDIVKEVLRKVCTVFSIFMLDKVFIECLSTYIAKIHSEKFLGIVRLEGKKDIVEEEVALVKSLGNTLPPHLAEKMWDFRFLSTLIEVMGGTVFYEYVVPVDEVHEVYHALEDLSLKTGIKVPFYSLQITPKTNLVILALKDETLNENVRSKLQNDVISSRGTPYSTNVLMSNKLFLRLRKIFDPSNLFGRK